MTAPDITLTPEEAAKILDEIRVRAEQLASTVSSVVSIATDARFTPMHEKRIEGAMALAEDVSAMTEPAKSFVTDTRDLSDDTASAMTSAESGMPPARAGVTLASSPSKESVTVPTSSLNSSEDSATPSTASTPTGTASSPPPRSESAGTSTPASETIRTTSASPDQAAAPTSSTPREASAPAPDTSTAQATAPTSVSSPAPVAPVSIPETGRVSAAGTIGMTGPQVIDTFAKTMKAAYPVIPDTSVNPRLNSGLASGTGVAQPAGTVYLTDNQTRVLAEAIAHNINARRQAQAESSVMPLGPGIDGGGGFGGSFDMSGINLGASNNYHESVLMLANQLVSMQPPIPYAWGGGSLEGPSQGISDGGGYADACGDYNKIGFDCSGLSRYVTYQTLGEEIPRTSQPQFTYCTPVSQPMIGDLGFPAGGSPGHVVIYVGGGQIFEAQQSGTYVMFSNASPSYLWGRPQSSPNWALEQQGDTSGY